MAAELVQEAIAFCKGQGYIDLKFRDPIGNTSSSGSFVQHQGTIVLWISISEPTGIPPTFSIEFLDSNGNPGRFDPYNGYFGYTVQENQIGDTHTNGNLSLTCWVLEGHTAPNSSKGVRVRFWQGSQAYGVPASAYCSIHGSTWWGLAFTEYTDISWATGNSTTTSVSNEVPVGKHPTNQVCTQFGDTGRTNDYFLQHAAVAWYGPHVWPTYDNAKTFYQSGPQAYPADTIPLTTVATGTFASPPLHMMAESTQLKKYGSSSTYSWKLESSNQLWVSGIMTILDPPPPPVFNYHGWEYLSLSPTVVGGPAMCTWSPNNLHVFARKSDNNLYWANLQNNVWSGWTNLGGPIACDPQVVSFGDGWMDVFATNPSGNVMHRRYFNGHWEPWENLGGGCKVGNDYVVGCCSMAYGRIDLFVIGTDNRIFQRIYRNTNPGADKYPTGWGPWLQFNDANHGFVTGLVATGSPYSPTSGNSLATNDVGQIELAGRAWNGAVWHRSYNSSPLNGTFPFSSPGWQSWENLGGVILGRPGIASSTFPHNANVFDVFGRGQDNRFWENHFQTFSQYGNPWPSGRWSGWTCAGGPVNGAGVISPPGACYGYTRQTSSDDPSSGYPYPTWNAVMCDSSGYLRRVAWYGDKPLS